MPKPSGPGVFRRRNTPSLEVAPHVETVTTVAGLRERLREAPNVGLVPTMGNLHAGHLALVRACRARCRTVVVSIFVNPTQFGPGEDLESYPRTLATDMALLEQEQADVAFVPTANEMYPPGAVSPVLVSVPALAETLCGASRPGHFDGVATVVAKLFHVVAPQEAFFGEKDWQQLAVIRAMAQGLDMDVRVTGVPTVRAPSGLALSSRNAYLSAAEREQAAAIHRCLQAAAAAIRGGERDHAALEANGRRELGAAGLAPEYVAVRDAERLVAPSGETSAVRILAAARLGAARLIDNVGVDL